MDELLSVLRELIEYGIAFAVLTIVTLGFMTDRIRSSKSADRELNREREISSNYSRQVDELTNALEKRNDLDEARLQFDRERVK